MPRSDRLEANALARALMELQRNFNELVTRQPTSGRSGVQSYVTRTAGEWDLEFEVGSDSDSSPVFHEVEVIYRGDKSQRFPTENVFADLRFNGTSASSRPTLGVDGIFRWSDGTRSAEVLKWAERDKSYLSSEYEYRWIFTFTTFKRVTVRFKAAAAGSSPGELSVRRQT